MATEDQLTASGPAAQRTAPAAQNTSPTLLRVEGLTVAYGHQTVVHGVDFALERGQSLALIGESGSGKSTIARTVLRLLPPQARVLGGQVQFSRQDVLAMGERQFRPLRGREIGFVPQDPSSALNAVRTIGSQALEAAALLPELDAGARRSRVLETFEQVENALLDRHVEAGGGLIGHDQRGPRQHGQADQHPLEHAAGELVRVGPVDPLRVGQADLPEGLEDACPPRGGVSFRQQGGRFLGL